MLLHAGRRVWLIHEEKSLLKKQLLAPSCARCAAGPSLPRSTTGTKEVVSGTCIFECGEGGRWYQRSSIAPSQEFHSLGKLKTNPALKNKLRSLLSHNLSQQDLATHSYSWAELKSCSAGPISPFSTAVGFKNSKSRFRISPPWLLNLLTTTSDSKFREQRHSWHKWTHRRSSAVLAK